MDAHYDPNLHVSQYFMKDETKLALMKRIIEKEKLGMEPIHPIKDHINSWGRREYYTTMRWEIRD